MSQNTKYLIAIAIAGLSFFAFTAAKKEYVRIESKFATTQANIDAVAVESRAAIADIRRVIKSLTDLFAKTVDDKAMQVEETLRREVYEVRRAFEAVETKAVEPTVEVQIPELPIQAAPVEETKPIETPKGPLIVMHSGYSCGPCNAWSATEKAKWEKAGWIVEIRKEADSLRAWPWFDITQKNGFKFEVDGPLTNDSFYNAQKKLLGK